MKEKGTYVEPKPAGRGHRRAGAPAAAKNESRGQFAKFFDSSSEDEDEEEEDKSKKRKGKD